MATEVAGAPITLSRWPDDLASWQPVRVTASGDPEVGRPLGDDDIVAWAEPGGPIMLKASTSFGDPVELNESEARKLADLLVQLAQQISD